ncbi:cryptochrome/photolyase family protein [Roseibium sp.]|uniref:cryptochrome/photolyase family protein n=1 Tax=Roseibium sp. TaxID=1936156 RepID=UPI003B530412
MPGRFGGLTSDVMTQANRQETSKQLILLLGDQLSLNMTSLKAGNPETDVILMAEVAEEASYVPHHKKKIAFVFSSMRHFALELEAAGWTVRYTRIDDPDNAGSLLAEVKRALKETTIKTVVMTEPGEYRLKADFKSWVGESGIDFRMHEDTRFICSHDEFRKWSSGRKQLRMEYFYRDMRRKTGLLMNAGEPEGGRWNFDTENRKPAKHDLLFPRPLAVESDAITADVLDLVDQRFATNFGTLRPFRFGVTRSDAERALKVFVEQALPCFGDYQDAMVTGEPFLYHSVLAQYINVGLLDPLMVCREVERAYYEGNAPLNAVEGFIRQIIGWREYVRGIYWLKMPGYTDENFFGNHRPLPNFYWNGDTEMACLHSAIGQTRDEAYAHHIQRLMITGNFALLAGVDPHAVHEWYLAVYTDAYEWVEAPNVIGMSQFADGGLLGSKPYAASGNYINKMSDYCGNCRYDVRQKSGPDACPFNPLYWDFMMRNEDRLRSNPRLAQVYRTLDRMDEDKKVAAQVSAKAFLASL